MTLPDTIELAQGTAITLAATGESPNHLFTFTSLANGAARQSAKVDLGANWSRLNTLFATMHAASAATTGKEVAIYWGGSTSGTAGTDNPGALTGSDGALASPAEIAPQLEYIGSIVAANSRGTNIQSVSLEFAPKTRYGMFVVYNLLGVGIGSTDANNTLTITPAIDTVVD